MRTQYLHNRFTRSCLLIATLAVAPVAFAAEAYDLIDVNLKEGAQVRVSEKVDTTMQMKMSMPGAGNFDQTVDVHRTEDSLDTYKKIADGVPSTIERQFTKRTSATNMRSMMGSQNMDHQSPLEGKTVTFERQGDTYVVAEGGGSLPEEAKEELAGELIELTMLYIPGAVYPDRKVEVGESWEMEPERMQAFLKSMRIENGKGSAVSKFEGVQELNGEKVAVITTTFDASGQWNVPNMEAIQASLQLTSKSYRSLEKGIDLKSESNGTLRGTGEIAQEGMTMKLSLEAPIKSRTQREVL